MRNTFSSLSILNYRLWFASALVSNLGTWMQRIAQDWLVLTVLTDDSGVAVGITTGLQFLPFLLLGPFTGVVADRVDHRKMLMVTQTLSGALGLGLGVLVLAGSAELLHVYGFALALGIVTAFDAPARQTFVGDLVPRKQLANAVGLNSASFNAARLIGPGVAGVLIAVVGTGWVFIINGATFAATLVALAVMRGGDFHAQERAPRSPGQVIDGLRYVRGRRDLMIIFVVVSVVSTFGLNLQLTSAMMARIEFDKGPEAYGMLGTILAIGSLTGAIMAARREAPSARLVVMAAAGFAAASAVMAVMPTYWTYALSGIPVGFTALTMLTAANATVQTTTPAAMRGRVMALYMMVLMGANPLGSPAVGWVGEHLGPRLAIAVGSITALAVVVAVLARQVVKGRLDVALSPRRPFLKVTAIPEVQIPDP
ncbi:MFS transporter [Demequina sp. TTPB684]|uniref:MFS transporter n=1 Tax=unclassified Demequina TaxID=2620311 RepID=UPI001CF50201|nr:MULTISPECIES: MFS transporter [unclassified Demequina]MCB2412058.1 MFS transporter [Demequina sp. TTPB684]UPU88017.1 MFS transporter [Demequina sp. TMPB413]